MSASIIVKIRIKARQFDPSFHGSVVQHFSGEIGIKEEATGANWGAVLASVGHMIYAEGLKVETHNRIEVSLLIPRRKKCKSHCQNP